VQDNDCALVIFGYCVEWSRTQNWLPNWKSNFGTAW